MRPQSIYCDSYLIQLVQEVCENSRSLFRSISFAPFRNFRALSFIIAQFLHKLHNILFSFWLILYVECILGFLKWCALPNKDVTSKRASVVRKKHKSTSQRWMNVRLSSSCSAVLLLTYAKTQHQFCPSYEEIYPSKN